MMKLPRNNGFTLVEILLGVMIVSLVLTVALTSLSSLNIGKVKLVEKTFLEKQVFAFQESFFEAVKKGGVIDYEEYFNRHIYSPNSYISGHYMQSTGFGNFGADGVVGSTVYGNTSYSCRSAVGVNMGTGGCLAAIFNTSNISQINKSQRYGSYEKQFIDYNSDVDSNLGDENADGDIKNDDDDEYLGIGPQAFTGGLYTRELYLINAFGNERTIFRRNVIRDPSAPVSQICDFSNPQNPTGEGCLGMIEFLKLRGQDYGEDHDILTIDANKTQYDGKIDTWFIHPDFLSSATQVVAGSNNISYWQPLFTNTINVKNLKFFLYPHKNSTFSWKDNDPNILVAPYLRVTMELSPSWSIKRKIKGAVPSIPFSTTIHLTDLFSN